MGPDPSSEEAAISGNVRSCQHEMQDMMEQVIKKNAQDSFSDQNTIQALITVNHSTIKLIE